MVDVRATNAKLAARVKRIVQEAAHVGEADAAEAVRLASGSAKVAIVMLLGKMSADAAASALAKNRGSVRQALKPDGERSSDAQENH